MKEILEFFLISEELWLISNVFLKYKLSFLKRVCTLEEINLYQNGINAIGIKQLVSSFGANHQLKIINLSDNTFTAVAAEAIALVFPFFIKILYLLFLFRNQRKLRNSSKILFFSFILKKLESVQILCKLSETWKKLLLIFQVLPQLPLIEELNFSDCLCRNKGASAIITSLNPNIHQSLKVDYL